MAGGRGPGAPEAPSGGCTYGRSDCTLSDYDRQGWVRSGRGSAVFRMVIGGWDGLLCGASLGPLRCSPCFRPGVQFLPGCVQFSAKCVHFPARCVHFSRQPPQMCPLGPRMCPPGPLTGDSRRPGLPGGVGVISAAPPWEQGEPPPAVRGAGQRSPDLPFRDLCVTRGGLPGRPSPQPSPTGRGGTSGRAFKNEGAICKSRPSAGAAEGVPALDDLGRGRARATGGRPGGRRGLRRGPGGRTGG